MLSEMKEKDKNIEVILEVLILVVMEDALGAIIPVNYFIPKRCLNPCCNGRCSRREQ